MMIKNKFSVFLLMVLCVSDVAARWHGNRFYSEAEWSKLPEPVRLKIIEKDLERENKQDALRDQIEGNLINAHLNAINLVTDVAKEQAKSANKRAEIQAQGKADALKAVAVIQQILKPANLMYISGAVIVGGAGISAAYFASKLGFNYLNMMLGRPKLIRETSIKSQKEIILDYILGRKPAPSRFNEIVLDAELEFKLKEIADTIEMGIQDGEGVRHVLLTGPAGTGKTMFAKAIAMRLNQKKLKGKDGKIIPVNYMCCAGADFAQFKSGDDIAEIHNIVDYALKADGITVLFIDEIDSLIKNRLDSLVTEDSINRTNTMLSIFDKPTHGKIMLIGATNFESKLDKAAYSRFSKKVAFKLPTGQTLTKLFDQYVKKEVLSKKITTDATFNAGKQELIDSLQGLSPRTIEDLASQMYSRVRFLRKKELTYEIAQSIIQEAKEAEIRNNSGHAAAAA